MTGKKIITSLLWKSNILRYLQLYNGQTPASIYVPTGGFEGSTASLQVRLRGIQYKNGIQVCLLTFDNIW